MDFLICEKRRSRTAIYGVAIFLFFLLSSAIRSEEIGRAGFAGSAFRMGLGARAMGMGGGSVALADDGHLFYYNPAGLVFLEEKWVSTTLNSMALDRQLYYIGYAQSFKKNNKAPLNAGFSIGWFAAGIDNIDARDFSGNDIGTLSSWEHCFSFSFALEWSSFISTGFNAKLYYNRFPGIKDDEGALAAKGFGFDLGVMVKPVKFLTAGIVLKDMNAKYTWDTQELYERGTQTTHFFPQVIRGGVALHLFSRRLNIVFDIEQIADIDITLIQFEPDFKFLIKKYRALMPASFYFGFEYQVYQRILLRSGIRNGDICFGAGYRHLFTQKSVIMDYAYCPDTVAPRGNHIFSWSFLF